MAWHQNYDEKLSSYRKLSAEEKSLFYEWDDAFEDWTDANWTTGAMDWYYRPGGAGREKPSLENADMNLVAFLSDGADLRLSDLPSNGSSADFMVFGSGGSRDDGGANYIETGNNSDIIVAYSGDDTVGSGGGGDLIYAGEGNDVVNSGSGDDSVVGDAGDDSLDGSSGEDTVLGGSGDDTLSGGSGGDSVVGGAGADVVASGGFDGIDYLWGDDDSLEQDADTFWLSEDVPAGYAGTVEDSSFDAAMKYVGVAAEVALDAALDSKWAKTFFLGEVYEAAKTVYALFTEAAGAGASTDYGDNDYTVIKDFDPRYDKIYLKFGDWGSGTFRDTDAYWDNSNGQAVKEIYYDGDLMAKIYLDSRLAGEIDDGDALSSDEQAHLISVLDAVWDQRAFMGVDDAGNETYAGIEASYEYDSDGDGQDDAAVEVFGAGVSADDLMGRGEGLITLGNWGAIDWSGDGDGGTVWGTHGADILRAEDGDSPSNTATTIHGWDGSDVVVGSGGSDTLYGGQGADYLYGGDTSNTSTKILHDYLSGGEGADWIAGGRGFNIIDGGSNDADDNGGSADDEASELYDSGDTASYASLGKQDDGIGVTVDLRDQADLTTLLTDDDGNGVLDEYRDAGLLATTDNGSNDIGSSNAYGDVLSGIENIVGSQNSDAITGDDADNVIATGAGGSDTLDGGAGTDTVDFHHLSAGVTASLMTGTYTSAAGTGTIANFEGIRGTDAADALTGDASENLFHGTFGNDSITGGEGWDIYDTTAIGAESLALTYVGNDANEISLRFGFADGSADLQQTLFGVEQILFDGIRSSTGGAGNDSILGGSGDDVLNGNGGNDTIDGGGGRDYVHGGDGDDVLHDSAGRDFLYGGADDDVFYTVEDLGGTNEGIDWIHGGDGYDTVYIDSPAGEIDYASSNNGYVAGAGLRIYDDVEHIVFGDGDDVYMGFRDHGEVVDGGDGNDLIYTQSGNDTIVGSRGSDEIKGGGGEDTLDYSEFGREISVHLSRGAVAAAAGITSFQDIETVVGSDYDDTAFVAEGDWPEDSIVFDGGAGTDTFSFEDALSDHTLASGSNGDIVVSRIGQSAAITLHNVETISFAGVSYASENLRIGNNSKNWLKGSAGEDLIVGNGGHDNLKGSWGDDTLIGGTGNDTIRGDWAGGDRGNTDTAVYFGRVSDYAVTRGTTTIGGNTVSRIVVDERGAGSDGIDEGRDVLIAIEELQFADATLTLDDLDRMVVPTEGGFRNAGTAGDDVIVNGEGLIEPIYGGDGDDTFYGSAGVDAFYGIDYDAKVGGAHASSGTDTVHYEGNLADYEIAVRSNSGAGGTYDTIHVTDRADGGTDGVDESSDTLAFIEKIAFADQTISGGYVVAGADLSTIATSETLKGTGAAAVIFGNGGADTLIGGVGDDTLVGGTGNDTLYGGSLSGDAGSVDVAVFSGRVTDYDITGSGDWVRVRDRNLADADTTDDGTDTLHDVEYLRFADITLRTDAMIAPTYTDASGDEEQAIGGTTGMDTEYLMGSHADSTLTGTDGVDTYFIDRSGDDSYKAGGIDSTDTVIYGGSMADYALSLHRQPSDFLGSAYALQVEDLGKGIDGLDDGTDLIWSGIDYLQFADGRIAVTDAIEDLMNDVHRFDADKATASVDENTGGTVYDARASVINPDGDGLTWTLSGEDAAQFAIDSHGRVSFITTPNHEAPTDADGDNVYDLTVHASDAFASDRQDLTVAVENVVELSVVSGTATAAMSEKANGATGALALSNIEAGGAHFVSTTLAGAHGTLAMSSDGSWTYIRTADMSWLGASESHTESFTVSTTDNVDTDIAITIDGVNDAPVAPDIVLSALEAGDTIVFNISDYLATVSDIDSDTIQFDTMAIYSGGGSLTANSDNTFTYTAEPGDDSAVRFVYTVSDRYLSDEGHIDIDLIPATDSMI